MHRRLVKAYFAAACLLLVCLGACGGSDDNGGGTAGSGSEGGKVTLTVFGAASLTDAFTAIGKQFQQ